MPAAKQSDTHILYMFCLDLKAKSNAELQFPAQMIMFC